METSCGLGTGRALAPLPLCHRPWSTTRPGECWAQAHTCTSPVPQAVHRHSPVQMCTPTPDVHGHPCRCAHPSPRCVHPPCWCAPPRCAPAPAVTTPTQPLHSLGTAAPQGAGDSSGPCVWDRSRGRAVGASIISPVVTAHGSRLHACPPRHSPAQRTGFNHSLVFI